MIACMASTAMVEKKSLSAPMILEDMDVVAHFFSASLPSVSVLMAKFSVMNLHACSRSTSLLCTALVYLGFPEPQSVHRHGEGHYITIYPSTLAA